MSQAKHSPMLRKAAALRAARVFLSTTISSRVLLKPYGALMTLALASCAGSKERMRQQDEDIIKRRSAKADHKLRRELGQGPRALPLSGVCTYST